MGSMLQDTPSRSPSETPKFRPHIVPFTVAGKTHKFLLATEEAKQWYDPPKPHAMLEYDWIAANLDLSGESVVDVGAHHGHYALVLAGMQPAKMICVDAVAENCSITTENLSLNRISADVRHLAVTTRQGIVEFTGDTNGRVVEHGAIRVPGERLPSVARDATVIKLDIEGEEFRVLPDQLDELPDVHTWIIEIHPWKTRNPQTLMPLLLERFNVDWVNRAAMCVEPYPADADWSSHTTVICRRRHAR